MQGGLPLDLILFAMVAAFLVLRLRSVLGRRTGFERPPAEGRGETVPGRLDPRGTPPAEVPAGQAPVPGTARHVVPDRRAPAGQGLERLRGVDPSFDPVRFLGGAEAAFRLIVRAFADGDREALRPLLGADTLAGFEGAIAAREAAGERQRTEIRSVQELAIEAADLRGTVADVTVRITSDQVNVTTSRDGLPTAGAEAVAELVDLWTFQRDLRQPDPTWRLVASRSA